MSVDSTLLMREVESIRDNGESNSGWRLEARILANGKWLRPFKTEFYGLTRNYADPGQFTDRRMVQLMLQRGDFQYDIIPNRDNLQIEISYIPVNLVSTAQDLGRRNEVIKYRAVLMNQVNNAITNKESQVSTREALNQLDMIHVPFQLIEEVGYLISMMSFGESFRQVRPLDAIRSVLAETIDKTNIQNSKGVLGINASGGDNTLYRAVIDFPDGIRVRDVAHYIQNEEGGVYATGLGCYLQDQYWYIYSLYDSTKYSKNTRTLKIINVPNDRYKGSEKTYKITTNQVTILATGNAKVSDNSLGQNLSQGNGLRFGKVDNLLGGFGVAKDNRTLVDRASNVYEVSMGTLETGMNNLAWTDDRATSNPFKHYTEIAKRRGMFAQLEWYHGDTDLLLPGMPVKYYTVNQDKVEIYNGVLLGVDEQRTTPDIGVDVRAHVGIVTLGIFINRKEGPDVVNDPTAPE